MSPLRSARSVSCANVQMPIVPRSFSSASGQVDIVVILRTVTRGLNDPADWSDGLFRGAGESIPGALGVDRLATGATRSLSDPGLSRWLGGRRAPGPGHRDRTRPSGTVGVV